MPNEHSIEHPLLPKFYEELLTEQGYRPKFDDDGDIVFKSEGKTLVLHINEEDEEFFRLSLPCFFQIENDLERELSHKAALIVNAKAKVVKIVLNDDYLWSSVEMFCSPIQSIQDVIERSIKVLHLGVKKFHREYAELLQDREDSFDIGF